MTEKNLYRIKENIVHISMNAGILLQAGAIEVDSSTLTDTILDLADVYEEKIYETVPEGEYFESIDLFSNRELLKAFHSTDVFPIGSIHRTNDNTGSFQFYLNEDALDVENREDGFVTYLDSTAEKFIEHYLRDRKYLVCYKTFIDSVLTVEVAFK